MRELILDDFLDALDGLPPVLGLRQAARATGLSTATLRRRVQSGELHAMKTRPRRGGRLKFLKREIARFLLGMAK